MGAPVEAPTASSLDVEHPNTNSVPELHGKPHTISSGWIEGSPEESNTKTQKPHDAIFMFKCALNTSLWKTWVATMLFLQTKAKGTLRMKTNTVAIQDYRPHLPAPVSDNKSARCRMSANVNLSDSLPVSFSKLPMPWCPRNCHRYLLRRFDHHLLQGFPALSSHTALPPRWQHLNREQNGNWGLNCSPKVPHQLPTLVGHWRCSHQKGKWSLLLLQLNSMFQKMNEVAIELLYGGLTYSFEKTPN